MLFTRLIASQAMTGAARPLRVSRLSVVVGNEAGFLAIVNYARTTSHLSTASARRP
jgi:hypothetical protein